MQIGPLEIVIVLIIALLIFGGRFGGIGRNIGGRLRRTKDAAVEAGQGLRDGELIQIAGVIVVDRRPQQIGLCANPRRIFGA